MEKLKVFNPSTNNLISELEMSDLDNAQTIINSAFQTHQKYPKGLPKAQRIEILENFYLLLLENRDRLTMLSIQEGGKPIADSIVEMDRALEGVKLGINAIHNIKGSVIPMELNETSMGKFAVTKKLPRGVVFSISAFNHPINLTIHQIVPAIAAGCPVVYKPALTTPLVSKEIINLLLQSGLPKAWCYYLICNNEVTSSLISNEKLAYVSFIGSHKVGWQLKSKLAPGVKIALEHGGNAPVIVDENANLSLAIPQIVKAGYYHAGQVCVSAQRIYVHAKVFDEFVSQLTRKVKALKVGVATDSAVDVGPIINSNSLNRIHAWVQDAIQDGAELLMGGNIIDEKFYEPTILLNPSNESLVTQKEIFGPVLCIYKVNSIEKAVEEANESPFVFQSSAYTSSLSNANYFSDHLNGAAVLINIHPAFRVDWMPFGGQGLSGEGLGGIQYSVNEMLKEKLVIVQK